MRRSLRWLKAAVCIIVIVAVSYAVLRCGQQPAHVTLKFSGTRVQSNSLIVSLVASNAGQTPLISHQYPLFREVSIRTARGWTNFPQSDGQASTIGLLLPGRSISFSVTVPSDARGFRVTCPFTTAGARTWAIGYLIEAGWWNRRLHFIWDYAMPLLPDGRDECVTFSTPVVDVPASE